jgi:hypothetical protein
MQMLLSMGVEIYETRKGYQTVAMTEQTDSKHDEDKSVGEWGDVVDGIDVGNVIRDVLLTLRDHPEIVRKLIEGACYKYLYLS